MRKRRYTLCILWTFLCTFMSVRAEEDSIRFSLLTCSPGEQVYELFGHTAIRYQNKPQGLDVVYNYGLFDFDSPNFVWRFVRGETDYQLGVIPYVNFELSYRERGSAVFEQELNLTPAETNRLDSLLRDNWRPENRVYRYNYFYDNCTTRARDRIEEALGGVTFYPPGNPETTYRGWVHSYTKNYPWVDFGISLCLGSGADREIDQREQMFLPANLQWMFTHATVHGSGGRNMVRRLVKQEGMIIAPDRMEPTDEKGLSLTPMQTALILLAIVFILSLVEWRRHRVWWGIDLFFFSIQGLAGCIIAFLFFFSVHPTVGSNWLLIILNPIPLFYLPVMIYHLKNRKKDLYDVGNAAILTLFIAFLPLIPQKISLVVVPLALILLIRSILHLVIAKQDGILERKIRA